MLTSPEKSWTGGTGQVVRPVADQGAASAAERRRQQEEHDIELPPSEEPKHPRKLPGN